MNEKLTYWQRTIWEDGPEGHGVAFDVDEKLGPVMAAGPTLLAALRAMVKAFENNQDSDEKERAVDMAEAAIKEAQQ